MSIHCYIYGEARQSSAACSQKMLGLLEASLAGAPFATLAISGGLTPPLLFGEPAKAGFDWSRVHLFWVDERGVPPTDPQSNYKLAKEHLIDPAGFPANNVPRIQAELELETAARLYAEDIQKFLQPAPGAFPQFDIIHRWRRQPTSRSFTNGGSRCCRAYWRPLATLFMLVAGGDKAEPLRTVLHEPYDPKRHPVQIATEDGRNVPWFLDQAAARLLN